MARTKEKQKAVELRKQGYSYTQIKAELGISKSTLSGWLKNMPLSKKRIKELRDNNQQRIERTRETKRKKKLARQKKVYETVSDDIIASQDQQFVSGFYLYWGEGTKTAEYTTSFTNSDPAMIKCFVDWLVLLGVSKADLRLKLHVYSDQDEEKLKKFWSVTTGVSVKNFNKSYRKESALTDKTYKGMFGHGTCVVAYHDRDMHEYVLAGIKYLRTRHG